ncbi:hypothetical protein M8J77_008909 [Diaphorina citri]|nr:hypothetical protein M8J77_008909 [Diaphorina citri]
MRNSKGNGKIEQLEAKAFHNIISHRHTSGTIGEAEDHRHENHHQDHPVIIIIITIIKTNIISINIIITITKIIITIISMET